MIAARRVQMPFPGIVSHTPSPGFPSIASRGEVTMKVAARTGDEDVSQKHSAPRMMQAVLLLRNIPARAEKFGAAGNCAAVKCEP